MNWSKGFLLDKERLGSYTILMKNDVLRPTMYFRWRQVLAGSVFNSGAVKSRDPDYNLVLEQAFESADPEDLKWVPVPLAYTYNSPAG